MPNVIGPRRRAYLSVVPGSEEPEEQAKDGLEGICHGFLMPR
jgi:hypothetical protein